jgi:chromosome segregation ATPase
MDQELIAYLDERFREINERFDGVDARLDGTDARLDRVDARLDRVDARIGGVDARFEQGEGTVRGLGVQIESLRGQIQQVAEGVAGFNDKLESFQADFSRQFAELREIFQTSHSNLHRRVSSLEAWREKGEPSPPAARKRRT